MGASKKKPGKQPARKPSVKPVEAAMAQIRSDLEGLERLQAMQHRLILEIRRQLDAVAKAIAVESA